MKKIFVLALILGIFCTAQAGYVTKGINTFIPLYDLKNYTLTLDGNGPVSAASMYTTLGNGLGRNSIVVIPVTSLSGTYFPVPFLSGSEENFNMEVRDFHYVSSNNTYVLCGSRETASYSRAFVAVIDGGLNAMFYNEYPEADMFYSIWAENSGLPLPPADYYVCGKSGDHGVIASIDRSNLIFTNLYITDDDQRWEYHKIILKGNTAANLRFVASGRTPDCDQIGFTVLNSSFTAINSYVWKQMTNKLSHCVVSEDVLASNAVILASSYQDIVTLNPVTYPLASVTAYRFRFPFIWTIGRFDVQDIGTIQFQNNFRISVVGSYGWNVDKVAWHGYVVGLSSTSIMRNNFYGTTAHGEYEHYKIRYNQLYEDVTGGYYQNSTQMCALFGTPLTLAPNCDYLAPSETPELQPLTWASFGLSKHTFSKRDFNTFLPNNAPLIYDDCQPFKGEEPAPKSVTSPENESEIATSHDRITLKDIPANTGYQIYNTIGQLISAGVTTPDISTANLSKGVYILRLESGKTFKFVK